LKPELFQKKIAAARLPLVVEFWAPWCGPCKMMNPVLKSAGEKYSGKVELLKINADEAPDLLRQLKVYSIPTVLVYQDGKQVYRRSGAQPADAIDGLFSSLASGAAIHAAPAPFDRLLRSTAGLVTAGIGVASDVNLWLIGLGGVLLFSAVYDRCPIYRAVSSRIKALLQKT
jgi:thioredoxin 1